MRIETVNHSNITHAFPCMAQFRTGAGQHYDLERSVRWIMRSMHDGFRGKTAFDGFTPIGGLFYGPLSKSSTPVDANANLVHLRCIYINPEKRGSGIGQSLIAAMKSDVGNYDGILVRATETPTYMHHTHLESFGFKTIFIQNGIHYMYLPIKRDEVKLKLIPSKYKPSASKIEITLFNDDFCPLWNQVADRIRKIASSFKDSISFKEIGLTPQIARQYGTSVTCLIDGENAYPGDLKDDAIRGKIQEAISHRMMLTESWDARHVSKTN